jgi:hypothetical protein
MDRNTRPLQADTEDFADRTPVAELIVRYNDGCWAALADRAADGKR